LYLLGTALHKYKDDMNMDDGRQIFRLEYLEETDPEEHRARELLSIDEAKSRLMDLSGEDMDITDITSQIGYIYPYGKAAHMMGKVTASQLENKDIRGSDFPQEDPETEFLDSDRLQGAERGNAYHKFFELMEYDRDLKEQLDELVNSGKIEKRYAQAVDIGKMQYFTETDLGRRMAAAYSKGVLFREKQFVMGTLQDVNSTDTRTGNEYRTSDLEDEELLLVQGIIDAYFIEESSMEGKYIVLVDYKTDKVRNAQYYIEKYSPQLNEYAAALERSTGMKVLQKIIYSLELGREIEC